MRKRTIFLVVVLGMLVAMTAGCGRVLNQGGSFNGPYGVGFTLNGVQTPVQQQPAYQQAEQPAYQQAPQVYQQYPQQCKPPVYQQQPAYWYNPQQPIVGQYTYAQNWAPMYQPAYQQQPVVYQQPAYQPEQSFWGGMLSSISLVCNRTSINNSVRNYSGGGQQYQPQRQYCQPQYRQPQNQYRNWLPRPVPQPTVCPPARGWVNGGIAANTSQSSTGGQGWVSGGTRQTTSGGQGWVQNTSQVRQNTGVRQTTSGRQNTGSNGGSHQGRHH